MARMEFEIELKVRQAIQDYINQSGTTDNLDIVAEYVEKETGHRPSLGTVAYYMNKAGYKKVWVKESR